MTINVSQHSAIRLKYLDGLRGLAAVYVMIFHIWFQQEYPVPHFWSIVTKPLRYGSLSVIVFIVLSGYCLMLPVVRSSKGSITGGFFSYLKRRARRILPPYYAALFLSLLLALLIITSKKITNVSWVTGHNDQFSPYFSCGDLFTHLLLIHNLIPQYSLTINSPMWTVATEWQIYFFFPFLLIPIWQKLGLLSFIIIAFSFVVLPHYLLHGFIDCPHPWFLGLFGFGMAAADIGFSQKNTVEKLRISLPWGILGICFASLGLITDWSKLNLDVWISESLFGLGTACCLIYLTNCLIDGKTIPLILKLLENKWITNLGTFSYSLYLIHAPVQALIRHLLLNLQLPPMLFDTAFFIIAVPLCLLIAYLFHLIFERPFISSPRLKKT